jgi:hypothetical protein
VGAVEDDLVVSEGSKPSIETVVVLEAMVGELLSSEGSQLVSLG